jgi:hypothetical protein
MYSVATGVQKSSLQQIDWSRPQFFRKGGDVVSVGFFHKGEGEGFFELEIKLPVGASDPDIPPAPRCNRFAVPPKQRLIHSHVGSSTSLTKKAALEV